MRHGQTTYDTFVAIKVTEKVISDLNQFNPANYREKIADDAEE